MIHQLRIYEIFPHNRAAFHQRFRDHAARLMKVHGFEILAMWESETEGRLEFYYLLAWPDEATQDACWAAFRADEEWLAIKRDTAEAHGDLVGEIVSRRLTPVAYSPALTAQA